MSLNLAMISKKSQRTKAKAKKTKQNKTNIYQASNQKVSAQ